MGVIEIWITPSFYFCTDGPFRSVPKASESNQKYLILLPGQVADLDRFLSAYENNEICSTIIK